MPTIVKVRKVFEALATLLILGLIFIVCYEPTRQYIIDWVIARVTEWFEQPGMDWRIQYTIDWIVRWVIYF